MFKLILITFVYFFSQNLYADCLTQNYKQSSTNDLIGNYSTFPVTNGYHTGSITRSKNGTLTWTNSAKVSWELTPTTDPNKYITSKNNPYYNNTNGRYFYLIYEFDRYVGFKFLNIDYFLNDVYSDSYDNLNNILSIRKVNVGLLSYCNVKVTVDKIISVGTPPAKAANDYYNTSTNELFISSVSVGDQKYYNVTVTIRDVLELEVLPTKQKNSLHGYANAIIKPPPVDYRYGFSLYTAINKIPKGTVDNLQYGWGTWIMPSNQNTNFSLCPEGTLMQKIAPERWFDVYQTIEGGPGQWRSSLFPTNYTKFRMNSTPDCYNNEVSTPGYSFYGNPSDLSGIAQISNTLILPPDGINFDLEDNNSALFGYGYFALPLLPKFIDENNFNVGNQSLTLIINSLNFKGPVAFYVPSIFTLINKLDPKTNGTGFDSKEFYAPSIALEVNTVPSWTSIDNIGSIYRKVPSITFPITSNSDTSLVFTDLINYSKQAIWNQFENYYTNNLIPTKIDYMGSKVASITSTSFNLDMSDTSEKVQLNNSIRFTSRINSSGNTEILFTGLTSDSSLPQYYKKVDSSWIPVAPSDLPKSSLLANLEFSTLQTKNITELSSDSKSKWSAANWSAGPFEVKLNDGSIVKYVWYKFINQPALSKLNIDSESKSKIQQLVENMHKQYSDTSLTIAPPSTGALVKIDPNLLVKPPLGLEFGYVPIAIGQR
jgi:hypothetical protein